MLLGSSLPRRGVSGRSEVRYKRAIPKDFGVDGEQYFIIMVQKRSDDSILEELSKIPIPATTCKVSKEHLAPEIPLADDVADITQPETTVSTKAQDEQAAPDNNSRQRPSPVLKTPPTVVRRGSMIFENGQPMFKDMPQYEPGGGLLLTETVGAAVDRMDDDTVTAELIRSKGVAAQSKDLSRTREGDFKTRYVCLWEKCRCQLLT